MPKNKNFSNESLKNLYEKKGLTTFQIAKKVGCCQATVWKKLNKSNIKLRLPGIKRVNISKEKEQDVAPETSLDEGMSEDEVRQWSELLEYGQKLEKSNIDDKE